MDGNTRRGDSYQFDFSGRDRPGTEDGSRAASVLAYLSVLFFLPLVVCPRSEFGRFHANQGLVLFLFSVVGSQVLRHVPLLGGFLAWLYGGLMILFMIIGMVNAYRGRMAELPIIGGIRLIR